MYVVSIDFRLMLSFATFKGQSKAFSLSLSTCVFHLPSSCFGFRISTAADDSVAHPKSGATKPFVQFRQLGSTWPEGWGVESIGRRSNQNFVAILGLDVMVDSFERWVYLHQNGDCLI